MREDSRGGAWEGHQGSGGAAALRSFLGGAAAAPGMAGVGRTTTSWTSGSSPSRTNLHESLKNDDVTELLNSTHLLAFAGCELNKTVRTVRNRKILTNCTTGDEVFQCADDFLTVSVACSATDWK